MRLAFRATVAALAICIAGLNGCTSGEFTRKYPKSISKDDPRTIYVKGTRAYHAVLKRLMLTEDEARSRVIDFVRIEYGMADPNAKVFTGGHNLIVGHEYVFAAPGKIGYETTGYYVDGVTGEVTFRQGVGLVRP